MFLQDFRVLLWQVEQGVQFVNLSAFALAVTYSKFPFGGELLVMTNIYTVGSIFLSELASYFAFKKLPSEK